MASFPPFRRRTPPLLGAVGFDGGTKPAIAIVIPPSRMTEEETVAASGEECVYSLECWLYEKAIEKCGWGFPGTDTRYANVVVSNFGLRTVEYDPPVEPATHDCVDTESFIGTDGEPENPLIFEYDAATRTADIGDCTGSCGITNDHGEDNDSGTAYVGELGSCGGNPTTDPTVLPILPGAINFEDPIEGFFDVRTYDEEVASDPGWTIDTNTATHKSWTWNATENHSNSDPGVLPRHQCFDSEDADVDWTTTVENTYDVVLSDLITTAELITAASSVLVSTGTFTAYSPDASCTACFNLSSNELQCRYTSVLVRITNISPASIVVTWDVATYGASTDPEEPCADDGNPPSLDPGSTTLAPAGWVDIPMYPDTSGANIVMRVENIACSWAP